MSNIVRFPTRPPVSPDSTTEEEAISAKHQRNAKWRFAYRQAMAKAVLEVLLANRKFTIESSRLSDRIIKRCLNANLNFTRDGHIPCRPPPWLASAVRLEALRHLKTSKDS